MLHGKTAAAIARAEYHMPEDICDAIACHTTGLKNHMTLLDKILYLADYIEETRDFPMRGQRRVSWRRSTSTVPCSTAMTRR